MFELEDVWLASTTLELTYPTSNIEAHKTNSHDKPFIYSFMTFIAQKSPVVVGLIRYLQYPLFVQYLSTVLTIAVD